MEPATKKVKREKLKSKKRQKVPQVEAIKHVSLFI